MVSKTRAVLVGLAAVGIAVVAVIALALVQPRSDEAIITDETETAEATPVIDTVSATSAFPFVERWVAQYNDRGAGSISVTYQDEVEPGNSDVAIVGNVSADNRTYIPVSPQAVAIVYNIPSFPDVPSGLKLNSTTLSSILNGSTTTWSNVTIRDLNPNLNLPSERIVVVYDRNNSSSLALLEQYLGSKINWSDNSIGVSGPAELASTVRKTPYSVGFVDHSYAIQTRMTFAALANSDGRHIAPSIESIADAIEAGVQIHNATDSPPFINASRLENRSYPLVGLYYAALADNAGNVTMDFVRWLADRSGGQQILSEVQYPPIYPDNEDLAAYM